MESTSIDFLSLYNSVGGDIGGEGGADGWTAGVYLAEAETCELTKTKGGDKYQVVVKFRFIGGAVDGRKLTKRFVITPGSDVAMKMFLRQMAALGITKEIAAQLGWNIAPERIAAIIVGKRCNAKVKIGTYQDAPQAEIDFVSAVPAAGAVPPGVTAAAPPAPTPVGQLPGAPVTGAIPAAAVPSFPPPGAAYPAPGQPTAPVAPVAPPVAPPGYPPQPPLPPAPPAYAPPPAPPVPQAAPPAYAPPPAPPVAPAPAYPPPAPPAYVPPAAPAPQPEAVYAVPPGDPALYGDPTGFAQPADDGAPEWPDGV